jgi:hypothetical protein
MCTAYTAKGWTVPNLAAGIDPLPSGLMIGPWVGWETTGPGPAYIPQEYIIPTLDDVPDGCDGTAGDGYYPGNHTRDDLAFLDLNGMHWDFFMNTNNWAGPVVGDPNMDDPDAYSDILDILKLHNPANHTVYHPHMGASIAPSPADPATMTPAMPQSCDGALSNDTCLSELQGVEGVIAKMSGGARPHLTRFRPPYGEPFWPQTLPGAAMVAADISKYAVTVLWDFETTDANTDPPTCTMPAQPAASDTAAGVTSLFTTAVGTAPGSNRWGIALMHGVLPWTHASLDGIFNPKTGYLATHGFKTATVEDAICWKYGMHSWDIVNAVNKYSGADARTAN